MLKIAKHEVIKFEGFIRIEADYIFSNSHFIFEIGWNRGL